MWPVHAACLLILIVYATIIKFLNLRVDLSSYDYSQLASEAGMIRSWVSDLMLWNYPAWSIHAEWFAYLALFPLAFFMLQRRIPSLLALSIAAVALAVHGALYDFIALFPGKILSIILPFFAGNALFVVARQRGSRIPAITADVAFTFVVGLLFFQTAISTALLFVAFGALILGLYRESGCVNALLSTRPLVYGGLISYSLYMTHALVEKVYAFIYPKLPPVEGLDGAFQSISLVAAAVAAATLMYHIIEKPSNKWLRNFRRTL